MKFFPTILLLLAVISFGVVIAMIEHQPTSGTGAAQRANVLVRFDQETINKISVKSAQQDAEMYTNQGFWFFSKPHVDRADTTKVNGLLDLINHLTILDKIETGELTEEAMGLDKENRLEVTVKNEDGDTEVFYLGSQAPRGNSVYAQSGDDVYMVDGDPRSALIDTIGSLRDATLVGAPIENLIQVGIKTPSTELTIGRRLAPQRTPWSIVLPEAHPADNELVDLVLGAVKELKIDSVNETNGGAWTI
ncbi:MAG: DUF4340 domain-containing protein, partial [Verrucomicrobiota bacterium]